MYQLNEKVKGLKPYQPIQGSFAVRLDANESFISLPEQLIEGFKQELSALDYNRYPDPYATKVCKAFANYYNVNEKLVTAGNGSDELISIILSAFFQKGDRLLTLSPDFSMYAFYAGIYELETIVYEKQAEEFDITELSAEIKRKNVAGVIFSNPCNPTSLGITTEKLEQLIRSVDCLVILDEAYMDFWEQSLLEKIEMYDNLIILRTCSKAMGLASIRLGFCVANATLTQVVRAVKSPYNVNSMTQLLGELVLSDTAYLDSCKQALIDSREYLQEQLNRLKQRYNQLIEVFPSKTNFLFVKVKDADRVYNFLLEQSIAVRKLEGMLRITAGSKKENIMLLEQLERVFYEINHH